MQVTAGMRKRMLVLIGVAAISGGAGLIAVAHAGSLQQGSGTGFIANLVPGSAGDNTADGVLGQVNFTEAEQNFRDSRGVNISPVGGGNVAIDRSVSPNRVVASDTNNNRVLGWTNISAFLSHAPANIVFGQPDFFSGKCNQNLGKPTPSTLCAPRGVAVDSTGRVYIADSGNNRVLEYDSPFTTNRVADDVFGQFGSFNTDDCNQGFSISQNSLCDQHGVGVDSVGNLYIADKENNPVVEFNTPEAITVTPGSGDFTADKVFGQLNNFTTGTCNNSGLNQNSLCKPYGVSADVSGNVYIADHDNNRLLADNTPLTTNTTADRVFGQFNSFTAANCNDDGTISALTLCKPSSAAPDSAKNLYIADSGNNRVLEYNTPLVSGTTADHVF